MVAAFVVTVGKVDMFHMHARTADRAGGGAGERQAGQSKIELEQKRGRVGAELGQSWNRSGRNSDAFVARFDKFVKIAAARVTEESAEEREKDNK